MLFPLWSLSSWLARFKFAPVLPFLPLTSITVWHSHHNCLFLQRFIILWFSIVFCLKLRKLFRTIRKAFEGIVPQCHKFWQSLVNQRSTSRDFCDHTILYIFFPSIRFHHHHSHLALPARIPQALFHSLFLTSVATEKSSRLHLVSAGSCCNIGSNCSSYLCSSMCRGPLEYIAYEFIFTFPAVYSMSS